MANSPLFPFGHGLSYTEFEYSPVGLTTKAVLVGQLMVQPGIGVGRPAIEAVTTVRNAGSVAGTEVVQLYLRLRGASVEQPVRVLEGFRRVALAAGEAKEVRFPGLR